jgi:hypothetical protein
VESRDGGPFSEADTEDRAVVEQACQPVREKRRGSAARRISVDLMVPCGRRPSRQVVRIGPTDLEVCRHDGVHGDPRAPCPFLTRVRLPRTGPPTTQPA